MTDRLLTKEDLYEKIKFGKTWIDEAVKDGSLPPPIPFGKRCVRWRESDIDDWIANLAPKIQPTNSESPDAR